MDFLLDRPTYLEKKPAIRVEVATPTVTVARDRTWRMVQRAFGVALTMVAWLIVLAGLAFIGIAITRKYHGELGQSADMTMVAAQLFGTASILAGIGLPNWVSAERVFRQDAIQDGTYTLPEYVQKWGS